ncbi:MAG: VWA domain-containing protein [bacterium]|nr:VWA domain-containing protein [bacterium]
MDKKIHTSEIDLLAFHEGRLDASAEEQVRKMLSSSEALRKEYEDLKNILALSKRLQEQTPVLKADLSEVVTSAVDVYRTGSSINDKLWSSIMKKQFNPLYFPRSLQLALGGASVCLLAFLLTTKKDFPKPYDKPANEIRSFNPIEDEEYKNVEQAYEEKLQVSNTEKQDSDHQVKAEQQVGTSVDYFAPSGSIAPGRSIAPGVSVSPGVSVDRLKQNLQREANKEKIADAPLKRGSTFGLEGSITPAPAASRKSREPYDFRRTDKSFDGTAYASSSYEQDISGDDVRYRSQIYPQPTTPQPGNVYNSIVENQFKFAKSEPLTTFSVDVDTAAYANVRRHITQGMVPPADAVRIEEMINYFSYNYPEPDSEHPFSVVTEVTRSPWNEGHALLKVGLQGKHLNEKEMPASNLVFLVDVSGSMSSEDKLGYLKHGLRMLTEQLRPEDTVSIVTYAGYAGVALPPTKGNEKEKIIGMIERLQSGGSTAGAEGILTAYKLAREQFLKEGNNRVILATDGDFNVGVSNDNELVSLIEREREHGIFLSVLGFGEGNYMEGKMEQLADKGNGNFSYIDNLLEAKKVLVSEMAGTLFTIAKDVKIQIEFNPAVVSSYKLLGYENRALKNEDFANDKIDAGEIGAGHSVTALYELTLVGEAETSAPVDEPLRYAAHNEKITQNITTTNGTEHISELAYVKLRYKQPQGNESILLSQTVANTVNALSIASEDTRFAAAVAEFGLLLRSSTYKGNASFTQAAELARSSRGKDNAGHRAEFVQLVEKAELLQKGNYQPAPGVGNYERPAPGVVGGSWR